MPKRRTRKSLVAELDRWFSKWIRLQGAEAGHNRCFTCGTRKAWQQLDCGHFQSRAKYSTRWEPDNCKPQCKRCNMANGGQQYVFGVRLNELEDGLADKMVQMSNQLRKFSNHELEDMINDYRARVKAILDK